jgi:hypothetical protein
MCVCACVRASVHAFARRNTVAAQVAVNKLASDFIPREWESLMESVPTFLSSALQGFVGPVLDRVHELQSAAAAAAAAAAADAGADADTAAAANAAAATALAPTTCGDGSNDDLASVSCSGSVDDAAAVAAGGSSTTSTTRTTTTRTTTTSNAAVGSTSTSNSNSRQHGKKAVPYHVDFFRTLLVQRCVRGQRCAVLPP